MNSELAKDPRIIVALDISTEQELEKLTAQLDPKLCRVKVGKELFTRFGPQFVEKLHKLGFSVFLDLKFHDIPNTVANACRAAADLGVWMLNVHASGGRKMLETAAEALSKIQTARPLLVGVTILTSLDQNDIQEIGLSGTPNENVQRLAKLSEECGLDGVVCSPLEVESLRAQCGTEFLFVTPGVRPAGSSTADQKRVMTPSQALEAGAHYLVIGRPITRADDPSQALEAISLGVNAIA